ncbi:MAG: MlaD family protein [Pseudonocardiaceae bacterium]
MTTILQRAGAKGVVAMVIIAALVVWGLTRLVSGPAYSLTLLMPSAGSAFENGAVMINGQRAGEVTSVGVRDGQAEVKVAIEDRYAPLHAGTTARIKWASVLGTRSVELVPGAETNPELSSGRLVTGNAEAVDIDELLNTLDEPTRKDLQTLVAQLNKTLAGTKPDLQKTLAKAGPTVKAIADLLSAVAQDGPALKKIISELHGVTANVSANDAELAASINNLNTLTEQIAGRQAELSQTIEKLPETIDSATTALEAVPEPVDSTRTLLRTLRPSTDRLPAIAKQANPVLADVRPALAMLPGTLADAQQLLQYTPGLVSDANAILPTATSALEQADPMVSHLRPYTPELVGWLSNWNGVFGSRDASGHYARALITASASSVDANPGVMPPGMKQDARPLPGSIAGQPWTDAEGDGIN